MNLNPEGLIAEQHHTDTFNLDAAAKGGPLRTEVVESKRGLVLGPPGAIISGLVGGIAESRTGKAVFLRQRLYVQPSHGGAFDAR